MSRVHFDLFSGIGGFAYAIDQVWDDVTHIFCDNDPFVQKVLAKHWPESEIYGDIRTITDTRRKHGSKGRTESPYRQTPIWSTATEKTKRLGSVDILTGGFPCQPFSQAGSRRGTSDDRFLWPEMLRVIRLTKPTWVIAENVRGLLTLEQGVVFEQVCLDLEASGYEVQPFIIPAVAVNAPHRRDRVWFIGHAKHNGRNRPQDPQSGKAGNDSNQKRSHKVRQPQRTNTLRFDTKEWERDWLEVATHASRVDDGLPDRSHRLKALGNAIVPQIAVEIVRGMI